MASTRSGVENVKHLLLEHGIALWKRRWLAVAICWSICVVGWATVWMLPNRYQSDARAYVDVNGLLTPLLKGLVVDTPQSQSIEYLRQTLLSRPDLEQVVYMANLAKPGIDDVEREQLVTDLAADITLKPDQQNLISLAYVNRSPSTAKNVVQALLTILSEKATASSRVEMDHARKFLDAQIGQYEGQLRAAEKRRADFRKQYADYFSDNGLPRLQVLQQQIIQFQQQYEDAQIMKKSLGAQMSQVPQVIDVDSTPTVSTSGQVVTAAPAVRLAQAQRNLAALELEDTDKHPDVLSARRMVADLKAQVSSHSGDAEGKIQTPNPAYEQIKLKYVDAATAVPLTKQRLDKAQADLDKVRIAFGNVPDIEAKAKNVDRDYDLVKANYDELIKRRQAAALSQAADDQADRTQFRVVDPPQIPIMPAFPNRPVLYSIVLLLGLGGGVFGPLLLSQMKPTFSSVTSLRELGLPVIGSIAYVRHAGVSPFLSTSSGRLFVGANVALLGFYLVLLLHSSGLYRGVI
jgi:polysaccharide chain length determinant protein (PEP-CTERM system associated)